MPCAHPLSEFPTTPSRIGTASPVAGPESASGVTCQAIEKADNPKMRRAQSRGEVAVKPTDAPHQAPRRHFGLPLSRTRR